MSAADAVAPVAMEEDQAAVAAAVINAHEEEEEEEEELHFVKRTRGKRSRVADEVEVAATVVAGEKGGGGTEGVDEDTSPRGPIDASQRDSPPKSSDDEEGDEAEDEGKLPGKKKLKLRRKGAAEEEVAAKKARADFGELPSDSEDDEDKAAKAEAKAKAKAKAKAQGAEEDGGDDFYYDEDDEEGMMELRLRENGTLSEDEEVENAAADDGESDESDLEDSEDELDNDDDNDNDGGRASKAKAARTAADATAAAEEPAFRSLETEEELAARRAKEKEETQRTQAEIMREASRRARLTGYHVAPDRDPFAYRKVFAHIRACVERLNLPPPPPDPVVEDETHMRSDGEGDEEDDEDEAEDDSEAEELEDEGEEEEEEEMVELELEGGDGADDDDVDDDMAALGLDGDKLAAMMAAIKAKTPANPAPEVTPAAPEEEDEEEEKDEEEALDVSAAAAAKELAAQKAVEERDAAEAAAANALSDDDLSEEEAHEMTRKERLRQLKRAKAFFKADARAAAARKVGEVLEDEAEMSDDGGHTDDEEEVEVEEMDGEERGASDRVIKRKVAKRKDGLLDREELEEMVDYIDFNDTADDDERRVAKRAAAHARFEEERDDEELLKMQEALKNGFRRPNKNGGIMGEDGPDYWQRRRRVNVDGDEESDEDDDLGIDIPDRAWEAVELSDDDDGEWAERAERRKRAAAADASKKNAAAAQNGAFTESGPNDDGAGEDSQLPSARDMGFGSQDFKAMMNAGRQRRNRVQRGPGAAASAMEAASAGGGGALGAFAPLAPWGVGVASARPTNAGGGSRLGPAAPRCAMPLERHASTSFLGRGGASRSNQGGAGGGPGLTRAISLGNGGASRSFVFGGGGDSQSMWDRDAEENGTAPAPTVLAELGGDDNARTDFGWAPREAGGPKGVAAAPAAPAPSRLGGQSGGQSLFSMLQTSQGWDEVLGQSDSLAEGVKAAKNIKLRPGVPL